MVGTNRPEFFYRAEKLVIIFAGKVQENMHYCETSERKGVDHSLYERDPKRPPEF
jgi:hypothetical protein